MTTQTIPLVLSDEELAWLLLSGRRPPQLSSRAKSPAKSDAVMSHDDDLIDLEIAARLGAVVDRQVTSKQGGETATIAWTEGKRPKNWSPRFWILGADAVVSLANEVLKFDWESSSYGNTTSETGLGVLWTCCHHNAEQLEVDQLIAGIHINVTAEDLTYLSEWQLKNIEPRILTAALVFALCLEPTLAENYGSLPTNPRG